MKTIAERIRNIALGNPPPPLSEIKILENCHLQLDGKTVPVTAGEVVRVAPQHAHQLIVDGRAELVGSRDARENRRAMLDAMLPPPVTPSPLPDGWDKLPECFARWHELSASLDALDTRRAEILKRLVAHRGKHALGFRGEYDDIKSLSPAQETAMLEIIGRVPDGGVSALDLEIDKYLGDALQRAEIAVGDWRQQNADALLEAKIAISDFYVGTAEKLARLCHEVEAVGIAIFTERVKALGLSDGKVKQLFAGSRDWLTYAKAAADPHVPGEMTVLWFFDSGRDQKIISTTNPVSIVCLIRQMEERINELESLLKEGTAELARARKAAKAAA